MKTNLLNSSKLLKRSQRTVAIVFATGMLAAASVSNAALKSTTDVCAIFQEKRGWYKDAVRTEKKWGVSVPVLMAIMQRESDFRHNARPPREGRRLLLFPGRRASDAYGFAQATKATWLDYKKQTRRWRADRDDFDDAIDFIGWNLDRANKHLGIAKTNVSHLYLAYHEGLTGYRSKKWMGKEWLLALVRKVVAKEQQYRSQLNSCKRGPARKYRSRR